MSSGGGTSAPSTSAPSASTAAATGVASTTTTGTASTSVMNWEPVTKRLLGNDLADALAAALDLQESLPSLVHTTEFPLLLSALLPAFSSILTHKTRPVAAIPAGEADSEATEQQQRLRGVVLDMIQQLPSNEFLRPHAPHLVALAMDVLTRDQEKHALTALRILFDLYKTYRSLPPDYVQAYLDFVLQAYRSLPTSIPQNFSMEALRATAAASLSNSKKEQSAVEPPEDDEEEEETTKEEGDDAEKKEKSKRDEEAKSSSDKKDDDVEMEDADADVTEESKSAEGEKEEAEAEKKEASPDDKDAKMETEQSVDKEQTTEESEVASKTTQPKSTWVLRSTASFRVLTECPLIVMLMFQLYPKFLKHNIPVLIQVMMEALALRPPPLPAAIADSKGNKEEGGSSPNHSSLKRAYFSRTRELVAAQTKTLSFLTYLLRSFSSELKPYEDRLANNVVALMTTCPRESMGTRKELLVATRHLLNSDFRTGFFRHVDALLDERVLMGSHHRYSDQTLLRPLAYTTLSDLVSHVRQLLTVPQLSRVVTVFSRVLHNDASMTVLPLSTQYTAIRTLLSVVDMIYHNQDLDPQLGRDMLVRVLKTLGDKLEALNEYLPIVVQAEKEQKELDGPGTTTTTTRKLNLNTGSMMLLPSAGAGMATVDSVRDLQSMIRAIIVGHKTVIYYLNNYRNQHQATMAEKNKDSGSSKDKKKALMPPPGSNEEVASAMLRLTHTEIAIIDQYIPSALRALKSLKQDETSKKEQAGGQTPALSWTQDKSATEQYRDALTYFAAAFTSLDGVNLNRTIGKHLPLLVDSIIEDPMMMVIPRHMLGSNPTTSFEFCEILLNYLVGRMDDLALTRPKNMIFVEQPLGADLSGRSDVTKAVAKDASERDEKSQERRKQTSTTLLQLFERVLKSLSMFPENESGVLRRKLRKVVAVCFRCSMENTEAWPDNYCMLLRYLFRSISAGKFEESYKELLPLIPTVLNGLYRVVCASEDTIVRHTAIELCLTIPARLSSLLPHMSLLLRIIIPALDSLSSDLVNLGLRTLEFWVDNLNPQFLYPEISKQSDLFAALMQSLSCHLKPAPYPYGLLTLRLLGKLGGKNRQFIREPVQICGPAEDTDSSSFDIECSWTSSASTDSGFTIPIPVDRCVGTLKLIALAGCPDREKDSPESDSSPSKELIPWSESSRLLETRVERVDFSFYWDDVKEKTKARDAAACFDVLREVAGVTGGDQKGDDSMDVDAPPVATFTRRKGLPRPKFVVMGLFYAAMIDSIQDEAWTLLRDFTAQCTDLSMLSHALVEVLLGPSKRSISTGLKYLRHVLELDGQEAGGFDRDGFLKLLLCALCDECGCCSWNQQHGVQDAICALMEGLGSEWSRGFEAKLVNASMLAVKSIPRELGGACLSSLRFFIRVCIGLYGDPWSPGGDSPDLIWDVLAVDAEDVDSEIGPLKEPKTQPKDGDSPAAPKESSDEAGKDDDPMEGDSDKDKASNEEPPADASDEPEAPEDKEERVSSDPESGPKSSPKQQPSTRQASVVRPSEDVFRVMLSEMASPQQIVRFSARFMLMNYIIPSSRTDAKEYIKDHMSMLRRVLFSRSLRLLPLPQQVGVIEGLALVVKHLPGVFPLTDQHLLAFLSELLKMCSVADGDMSDSSLKDFVVDKNGRTVSSPHSFPIVESEAAMYPTFASALFYRRESVVDLNAKNLVVQEELPTGVQFRLSAIMLLHAVIRGYSDEFFDAGSSTPVGNIRPHVISLLFRSLVSLPPKNVAAAYNALRDVLTLSVVVKVNESGERMKSHSRLPKELLQTCIRPVLLDLREYTRLSVPLLRGLSRLLLLLSSWFNKTLGEKLLDHLQKWTDPGRIVAHKTWRVGEEPFVAAAVVDIFSMLPHSSQFVEPLVKTCIKLQTALPGFKGRFSLSLYTRPLARYLNKYPQHTVSFFFQRLKTPMYSELLQSLVALDESDALRAYLSNKQCSVMILNMCFERPLAIIRSEKNSSSSSSSTSLAVHGISKQAVLQVEGSLRPMSIESLELQHQGFRLIKTLLSRDSEYFQNHNDIVRAFRWLWRSKGRYLRLQHEDMVSPRFHHESRMLASFLTSYATASPVEDLDILFELIRVFLQPVTTDFGFISHFLSDTVSTVLPFEQRKQVLERFFVLLAGESSEETKVLSIQILVYPMIAFSYRKTETSSTIAEAVEKDAESKEGEAKEEGPEGTDDNAADAEILVTESVLEKFVKEVMFRDGSPINCGDRLRVELLRLANLFLEHSPSAIEPFRKEMVRFCWSLLKNDDAYCKSWAYLVVCRFISEFDMPAKVTLQVGVALLRSHQPEGKDLVLSALDLLIPALPKRLNDSEFRKFIEQASQMMLDDGNSVLQLAHISQIIVRHPEVFFSHRHRFVRYMVSSLNRLGLPPNCPPENRVLALDILELLLDWEAKREASSPAIITDDNIDTLANFAIRLIILMAEPADGRGPKVDAAVPGLDERAVGVLRRVIECRKPTIRAQPFEKVVARERPTSRLLFSCLEILTVFAEAKQFDFFVKHNSIANDIVASCFLSARDDARLRGLLRRLVLDAQGLPSLIASIGISLEKIVIDATHDQRNAATSRGAAGGRHTSSRSSSSDSSSVLSFGLFSLDLISDICMQGTESLDRFASSLLALASILTKNHLMDATAKQRKGSSQSPTTGMIHHTPTIGILDDACAPESTDKSRATAGRGRPTKESSGLSVSLQCLIVILGMFERSDLPYSFTMNRKVLFQIVSSILDTSDNVQLLIIAVRITGKWLLAVDPGGPITMKERSSFMWKIASFDYSGLSSDVKAQPLVDVVSNIVVRLYEARHSGRRGDDQGQERALVACLLNADTEMRSRLFSLYLGSDSDSSAKTPHGPVVELLWRLLHTELEGLGCRFWICLFVDALLSFVSSSNSNLIPASRSLVHCDVTACQLFFEKLYPEAWDIVSDDSTRLRLVSAVETLLSKPYHAQFLRTQGEGRRGTRSLNVIRSFLNTIYLLHPLPLIDNHLLVALSENYNSWFEVLAILETQHDVLTEDPFADSTSSALLHCYRQLGEDGLWMSVAQKSVKLPETLRAMSLDLYGLIDEAVDGYSELMTLVESPPDSGLMIEPSDFEMDLWEERWVKLQKELCQSEVVAEYAKTSNPRLQLEVAWKAHDWTRVRELCSSSSLLASMEAGDPTVKVSETLLAVADGKLSDVENLHAQSAQLCLYKWQLLPGLTCGSYAHASLLHFFHRLVEIRESGQIMVETSNHSKGRTLPDLKNLLNAWRHRLPNEWEPLTVWDDIFSWRAQMFSAITSNFSWSDANTVASLHDRPWTAIRMAKTARHHGLRDVSALLLNNAVEERAMNVSDAFLKLREQILMYFNPASDLERHGGLNLINTTNLSFFDVSQKSELFRLKALFLASLKGRSKANQAYCHSVQICPTHSRAWDSWGGLCSSLGAAAQKQVDSAAGKDADEAGKDTKDTKVTSAKKVAQYLAQAMGCYLEAVQIDSHEWSRVHLPKCLFMLTKDSSSHGVLCQTFESRAAQLPPWVWLPWVPQLLTSLYRQEGRAVKSVLVRLVKSHPQAVYYPLRAFYLERRDVERTKSSASPSASSGQHMGSVALAEEMMSLLRRSHASLWSSLESILEELIVKFRPSYEEELLSTIIALLERVETQIGSIGKSDEESTVVPSVWKTLGRIAAKFFRVSESSSSRNDERAKKTAKFRAKYKDLFEGDFKVSATETPAPASAESDSFCTLEDYLDKLQRWKGTLEKEVLSTPESISLIESSQSLAFFGIGDAPDLWPGSCDTRFAGLRSSEREPAFDTDQGTSQSSASSSAAAALTAAKTAATACAATAAREGIGGDYGGGSSCIEIPGNYTPNNAHWLDVRPCPELHPKLVKFEPVVEVLRRDDQLIRRVGMVGSNGKTYRFLLQFAVSYSTRTDERTSQTYYILEKVIRKDIRCAQANLSIQPHAVIPVAQRLRLISEPESRTSLDEVHRKCCAGRGVAHDELPRQFNEGTKEAVSEAREQGLDDEEKLSVEKSSKLKLFDLMTSMSDDKMLLNHLHDALGGQEPLFQFRRVFAQQWAANCLLQYVFAVAERTPNRVVFLENTARVLAPDFRIGYTSHGFIESPSLPFRLSPNLLQTIGFPLVDGVFVTSMASIAGAARKCWDDIEPIFQILMRDDIVAFYNKSMAKSDSKTQEMEKQVAERVTRNVSSIKRRFSECAPKTKTDRENASKEPVDARVHELISDARDTEKLCMMPGNYQGWL